MNSKVFYILILGLYIVSSYFIYRYSEFRPLAEDETRVEAAIATADAGTAQDRSDEMSRINQEDSIIRQESYGYLAGGVFFVLCPTIMLLYKRKLVRW